jgi:HAD superfamily hydrolase (TIGR01509 family)
MIKSSKSIAYRTHQPITPMKRPPPAAILFDMDGLLIDSERIALASLDVAAGRLSLEFPHHVAQKLIGLGRDGGSVVIREHLGERFPLDEFWQHWSEEYLARVHEGVPAKLHVKTLLEAINAQGIPAAVATSTETPWAIKKLKGANLAEHFDYIVGRDAVAAGKPAPDLYLEAARRLNVSPADCWAFEDSLPGLRAALASGARTHWVPDLAIIEHAHLPSGVETVDSLGVVAAWL